MHMNEPNKPRPASSPADDLDSRIAAIAAMNIDQLRALWRAEHRCDPPAGLTKDLLARALTYGLQERAFGGLSASTARVLRSLGKPGPERQRHIKVGSLLIREHEGKRHEVVVIPGGFLWEGRTYERGGRGLGCAAKCGVVRAGDVSSWSIGRSADPIACRLRQARRTVR